MSAASHTNSITWHEIRRTGVNESDLPDAETEILIYCTYLDDTVVGSLDYDEETLLWIDNSSGQPLVSPAYWAEKPYPAGT